MTAEEHIAEAERLLLPTARVVKQPDGTSATITSYPNEDMVSKAQAHATLAIAKQGQKSEGLGGPVGYSGPPIPY